MFSPIISPAMRIDWGQVRRQTYTYGLTPMNGEASYAIFLSAADAVRSNLPVVVFSPVLVSARSARVRVSEQASERVCVSE